MEEYYKEMEMALVRANIEEEPEDTMAHFLNGLNPEIRYVVELQEYVELDDLLHRALRVEQQIKRKSAARRNSPNTYNQNWANRSKKCFFCHLHFQPNQHHNTQPALNLNNDST